MKPCLSAPRTSKLQPKPVAMLPLLVFPPGCATQGGKDRRTAPGGVVHGQKRCLWAQVAAMCWQRGWSDTAQTEAYGQKQMTGYILNIATWIARSNSSLEIITQEPIWCFLLNAAMHYVSLMVKPIRSSPGLGSHSSPGDSDVLLGGWPCSLTKNP